MAAIERPEHPQRSDTPSHISEHAAGDESNPTKPASELASEPTTEPVELPPRPGLLYLLSAILIGLVRVYQVTFRAFLGGHCRFEPSCSQYFILAVQKYGPFLGAAKGIWRICRCQPFCQGGYDPP